MRTRCYGIAWLQVTNSGQEDVPDIGILFPDARFINDGCVHPGNDVGRDVV